MSFFRSLLCVPTTITNELKTKKQQKIFLYTLLRIFIAIPELCKMVKSIDCFNAFLFIYCYKLFLKLLQLKKLSKSMTLIVKY